MKPLAVHWASSKPNFGDVLSPLICARVSGREIVWAPPERCDVLALGSLMQRLKERFWTHRVHVWGSGFIDEPVPHASRHYYHAVRGRLTRDAVQGLPDDLVLGDPGLLAHLLVEGRALPAQRQRVLVIPHYKDRDHPELAELARRVPGVRVIDVFTPALEILDAIRASEFVFASAMHGLIAADSLGVPNAWLRLSGALRGGAFKFRDYYSAFGLDAVPRTLSEALLRDPEAAIGEYRRPGLARIQERLVESFPRDV
ncbi:MAG: polysaccharide pyruvyl transferase family protein [Rhodocyclaceae bacterium]|nr:polysaccharide pyruvyl transferase family protein [Rhodocyclaceae bacterium]